MSKKKAPETPDNIVKLDRTRWIEVPIDEVNYYDRTPRQSDNPRYEEIKESIRAQRGLNNPLTVTRRPGDAHYIVAGGGNTRLRALKELLEETGDECFATLAVEFRPWTSDIAILTGHLIENELRGDLSTIEKALGLKLLRDDFEAEAGEPIGHKRFLQHLSEVGYTVSRKQIQRLDYLANRIHPLAPTMAASLSLDKIEEIRRIEKAYRAFAQIAGIAEADYEMGWSNTLVEHDDDRLRLDAIRATLDEWIADRAGTDASHVHSEIDAVLAGAPVDSMSIQPPPENSGSSSTDPAAKDAAKQTEPATKSGSVGDQPPEGDSANSGTATATGPVAPPTNQSLNISGLGSDPEKPLTPEQIDKLREKMRGTQSGLAQNPEPNEPNQAPLDNPIEAAWATIDQLRQEAYEAASALGECIGLEDGDDPIIIPIPTGMGFAVTITESITKEEKPTKYFLNEMLNDARHVLWWFLAGASSMYLTAKHLRNTLESTDDERLLPLREIFDLEREDLDFANGMAQIREMYTHERLQADSTVLFMTQFLHEETVNRAMRLMQACRKLRTARYKL